MRTTGLVFAPAFIFSSRCESWPFNFLDITGQARAAPAPEDEEAVGEGAAEGPEGGDGAFEDGGWLTGLSPERPGGRAAGGGAGAG